MKKIFQRLISIAMFALVPLVLCSAQGSEDIPLTVFSDDDVISLTADSDMAEYSDDEVIPLTMDSEAEVSGTFVYDYASLLDDSQKTALDDLARDLARKYNFGIYLVVIDDYTEYAYEIEDAAEYIYDELGLGMGNDRSGLLLLMSMDDRSYDLDAYGYGNTVFTDYGKEVLSREFLGNFRNDNWYQGFEDYITVSEKFLIRAEEGDPIDVRPDEYGDVYTIGRSYTFWDRIKGSMSTTLLIMIPLALIIAGVGISSEKKKMNNIHMATEAKNYVQDTRINFNRNNDVYTHSTTSRVRINTSSSSGGGRSSFGGGTTIRPSGHSHHSGHF